MGQLILVSPEDGRIALGSSWLADDAAGVALREAIRLPDACHCLAPPLGAYKFPEATSLRICFSRERSATRRRRRAFSRSRSFRRLACSRGTPPYSLRQRK